MTQYLRPKQEYIDRYDRVTVDRCRRAEQVITTEVVAGHMKDKKDESELVAIAIAFNDLHIHFVAGEMYSKRHDVINKWMKEDEDRDIFLETTEPPIGIKCLTCSRHLFVTHKHIDTSQDKPDRILFIFDCTLGHLPRRMFFDNGEEWKYEKPKCIKCKSYVDMVDEDTDEMWKSVSTCTNCGHVEISEIERTDKEPVFDPDFEKDRERFCSEKEGEKYIEWMRTSRELTEVLDKQKEKEENKELYDRVAKIRRLKIIELEQLIAPILEKEDYIKLQFKDPEISKDVTIMFTTHDVRQNREERASCLDLQKLLRKTLEDTNWRLMSEGLHYRLGMLEGRFRAYEKEEDLVKLLSSKKE